MRPQITNFKFKIERGVLLLGLQRVQGVIDKRSSSPIFSNVLIEGVKGQRQGGGGAGPLEQIQITATDLEIGIKGKYPAHVWSEGGIVVSGKKLYEIVREIPDGDIEIEVEDGRAVPAFFASLSASDAVSRSPDPELDSGSGGAKNVTIRSGKSYFKLTGANREEFPNLPEIKEDRMVQVNSNIYKEIVRKTLFAVAEGDARHVLNGALLEIEGAVPALVSRSPDPELDSGEGEAKTGKVKIRMVGTDGHRLAICERTIEGMDGQIKGEAERQIIIPKKTLIELKRLLDVNEMISINIGEKLISFKGEEMLITSRLVEGNYPNYKQVIPQKAEQLVRINRSNFITVIRRVSVMSREKTRAIVIDLSPEKAVLIARDPEIGESQEDIEVNYKGQGISIGLNYQYLLEALESLEDEEVIMEIQSSLSPCVIRQESDSGSLCIVMPMRVQETE